MTEVQVGEQFGAYRVLGVLGSRGVGQVLRATDTENDRDVVLTVLHPRWAQDDAYRQRFLASARVAVRLTEPHVVPIDRYGEVEGRLFLATRLVEGADLASLLTRSGPLDPARAVDLVGQVARALDAAHAAGLVHGALSTADVLLVRRGDGGDPAGAAAGEDVVQLTGLGVAPPVGPGEASAPDPRADVQALAGVLFELLTGRPPLPAAEPPAPSSLRPGVPPDLDGVVLRGLAADPGQRWTSAGGMAAAARAVLSVSGIDVPRPAEHPAPGGPAGPAGTSSLRGRRATRSAPALGVASGLAAVLLAARARWRARRRTGR
jgi:serine/threonine protein kinase